MNVNDCWLDYKEKVIHPDADEVQIEETKKAFYAGGISVLSILRSMDPAQAVQVLETLITEFKIYQESMTGTSFSMQGGKPAVKAYNPKLNGEP